MAVQRRGETKGLQQGELYGGETRTRLKGGTGFYN